MVEPRYQELLSKDISAVSKDGVHVTVIAGDLLGASVRYQYQCQYQYLWHYSIF